MLTSYGPGSCHYGINQSNLVNAFGPTKAKEIMKEEKKKSGKKRASKKAGRATGSTED